MEPIHYRTSDARLPSGAQVLAALVLVGGLLLFASSLAGGSWDGGQAPFPYVWRDVLVVHILCALPLAGVLAALIKRRLPAAGSVGMAVCILGASVVPLSGAVRASIMNAPLSDPLLGVVLRAATALGLTVSAALASAVLIGGRRAPGRRDGRGNAAAVGALGIVVLLLPPSIYVSARCQHDAARLGEFLEQSRFGEARTVVHGLLALDAERKWNGRPLPEVAAGIDRNVRDLEARIAVPLAAQATARERFDRARQLASLGRTEAAITVLQSVHEPAAAPNIENLRGTIYEARGEWETALGSYRRAQAAWESQPASSGQATGLLRATTGIAYCQRKLGHYAEAERAYQQVLALSPTADSYFLLAQFYQDTQQAEEARAHARRAMELAPARYRQQGEKLINQLTVYHFGCLGVFAAESDGSSASRVPRGGSENP